jgi:hypothetical protein
MGSRAVSGGLPEILTPPWIETIPPKDTCKRSTLTHRFTDRDAFLPVIASIQAQICGGTGIAKEIDDVV